VAARLAHTVVETTSSDMDELLRTWLEPFLQCSNPDGPADRDGAGWPDWCVVVDGSQREATPYSAEHGLALTDGIVHVRPSGDPYRAPHSVVAVCRAVFKALAVSAGGVNLHASCLVSEGRGVAVVGDRGAGKTTTLLAALRYGGFSLLANDQVVAVNTRAGVTKLWGYPALVKVRQASARLVPVPWESALWFEQDTLRSASSERTGVFAASTLCAAFGSNVVAEAEAAAMAIYEQSTDPDEFAVSAASPDGPRRGPRWAPPSVSRRRGACGSPRPGPGSQPGDAWDEPDPGAPGQPRCRVRPACSCHSEGPGLSPEQHVVRAGARMPGGDLGSCLTETRVLGR